MMLPVSVMKVMPTATQPMKDMAVSSALMLRSEVNPGVLSAKLASATAAITAHRQHHMARTHVAEPKPFAQRSSLMPPRPDG